MGEAKRRGTYEERRAAAIERDEQIKLIAEFKDKEKPRPQVTGAAKAYLPFFMALGLMGYFDYTIPKKYR